MISERYKPGSPASLSCHRSTPGRERERVSISRTHTVLWSFLALDARLINFSPALADFVLTSALSLPSSGWKERALTWRFFLIRRGSEKCWLMEKKRAFAWIRLAGIAMAIAAVTFDFSKLRVGWGMSPASTCCSKHKIWAFAVIAACIAVIWRRYGHTYCSDQLKWMWEILNIVISDLIKCLDFWKIEWWFWNDWPRTYGRFTLCMNVCNALKYVIGWLVSKE